MMCFELVAAVAWQLSVPVRCIGLGLTIDWPLGALLLQAPWECDSTQIAFAI
jgi:hypothetical protein